MTLTERIEAHFRVSKKCEGFLLAIQPHLLNEEFELTLGITSGQSVAETLGTARIQKRTTSQAGIQSFGFDELIASLGEMSPQNLIGVGALSTNNWAGRAVFTLSGQKDFIGLVIVRRRGGSRKKVPPNWDGTREEFG
ncbi:hypothetical protein [Burkholderia ubonensis]|uniref:hypothetical protein n=1 Tax=Burkholderia ubonensis TaxID=101571 RepID=UPI0012F76099|nr:hypothetical protein [Burkholderia ubonensis]